MRRAIGPSLALLGALLAAPAGLAQGSPVIAFGEAATTQEILGLRERVRAAIAAHDRTALNALYADNFMHLRDSGRVDLKPERIALLLTGEMTIETAPEENVTVQAYGPATAVATGLSAVLDPITRKPTPFRWLTVYARQDGAWRVAASQASRVRASGR